MSGQPHPALSPPEAAQLADLPARLGRIALALSAEFLGKDEAIRVLVIAALAGEHAVLVGPPGTAKSALVRSFAGHLHARYFEYLLTRFTEPNEIFGPVDLGAFREGRYERRMEGMLPEAEIVFLDELFKSNSAILNSLLGILNERRFTSGGARVKTPLISCFGASNEVPADEALRAVFDRFVLRIRSQNLDAHRFHDLLARGFAREAHGHDAEPRAFEAPLVSAQELAAAARALPRVVSFSEPFLGEYKSLVFQVRAEGVALSDRRAVKLLKLFAASAFLEGRKEPDRGDLFLLRHVWNHEEEASVLDALVLPVLDAHHREHPERVRVGALGVGAAALEAEIDRVRQVITGGGPLSDVQLFSQLRALGEIRTTLSTLGDDPRAAELLQRVERLLDAAFRSGRFSEL